MKRALLPLAIVAMAASCGGDFDPSSRITTLRVIAVNAKKVTDAGIEPKGASWAHPGDTVELNALWHDPIKRSTQWAWLTCSLPSSSTVLGCFQKVAADVEQTGKPPPFKIGTDLDVFRVTIEPTILDGLEEDAKKGATVGVVLIACPGTISIVDQDTKYALPIQCLDEEKKPLAMEEWVAGIKRIFIRSKDENADPVIKGVTFEGKPWPEDEIKQIAPSCAADENRFERCDDGGKHDIGVDIDPSTFEAGTDQFGIGFTEQIVVQYYATEGIFEYDVKRGQDPNTRFAGRSASVDPQHLWIVVRDNRGGVSWVERKIRIQ